MLNFKTDIFVTVAVEEKEFKSDQYETRCEVKKSRRLQLFQNGFMDICPR